jgi:hypothetical protein
MSPCQPPPAQADAASLEIPAEPEAAAVAAIKAVLEHWTILSNKSMKESQITSNTCQ